MKRLVLVSVLVLAGCDKVKPIVTWTCTGCKTLLASGVCTMTVAPPEGVPIPECKPGEVLVVENWKQVSREGAVLKLGCEKP